jgi:hypothetical protein
VSAAYFHEDRAGITGHFITAAQACKLLKRFDCEGDLEGGFKFCTRGGEGGMLRLVPVRVTPVDVASLKPDAAARLERQTRDGG